jgi:hypothetical protein
LFVWYEIIETNMGGLNMGMHPNDRELWINYNAEEERSISARNILNRDAGTAENLRV